MDEGSGEQMAKITPSVSWDTLAPFRIFSASSALSAASVRDLLIFSEDAPSLEHIAASRDRRGKSAGRQPSPAAPKAST
jgi:hypothetical protein